jgi:L-threonylcarbamoyladenylate synthase
VLRPGPITAAQIAKVLGEDELSAVEGAGIEAPGQMTSHYAPGKPVRLNAAEAQADEFHIGFGAVRGDVTLPPRAIWPKRRRISTPRSMPAPRRITPVWPWHRSAGGIGAAINDRLRRAAA